MKKHVATFCAVMLIVIATLTNLVGCELGAAVTGIELAGGYESSYTVGDTFDYDSVKFSVSYDDGTAKIQTAKELGATHNTADMSTAGVKSVTYNYIGYSATLTFNVVAKQVEETFNLEVDTFTRPNFYTEFLSKSTTDGQTDADFKIKKRVYEVGTDNKFLFKPAISGLDMDDNAQDVVEFVKTVPHYFVKDAADGEYNEITNADEIAALVTVDNNNGYHFSSDYIGKYVKLELYLDTEVYKLAGTLANDHVECEFILVNGYNVYDQMGLSVMDDIVTSWATLKDIQLEADSKKLNEYTDVTNVILHGNIELNPDLFPDEYFWSESDSAYNFANDALTGNSVGLQEKLNGSLRDSTFEGEDAVEANYFLSDNGNRVNMQKGLFNSSKCSLSGNYNSITIVTEENYADNPEEYKYNRNLYTVYSSGATGDASGINNPVSHWSLFKFYKLNDLNHETKINVGIKNVALVGSMGHADSNGGPAGLMMINSYIDKLSLDNVIGERFYTNMVCDGSGDDSTTARVESTVDVHNTKLLNSYSNMIYTWRSTVDVKNSILRDAGGPLFLLVDGERRAAIGDKGCDVTISADCELASYAEGTESWYIQWNVGALLTGVKKLDEFLYSYFNKTLQYVKSDNGATPWDHKSNKTAYVNIIAAMIPSPSTVTTKYGTDESGNSKELLAAGEFKTLNAAGEATNHFILRTPLMDAVNDMNTVMFESGSSKALLTGQDEKDPLLDGTLVNNDLSAFKATLYDLAVAQATNNAAAALQAKGKLISGYGLLNTDLSPNLARIGSWIAGSNDYLCTYMSAGLVFDDVTMPYFGLITTFGNVPA